VAETPYSDVFRGTSEDTRVFVGDKVAVVKGKNCFLIFEHLERVLRVLEYGSMCWV